MTVMAKDVGPSDMTDKKLLGPAKLTTLSVRMSDIIFGSFYSKSFLLDTKIKQLSHFLILSRM